MSNENILNKGGGIVPTARRSIHSHLDRPIRPFYCDRTMGRFGLSPSKNIRQDPNKRNVAASEGIDEVDNVISKFQRQPSPTSPKTVRRNSYKGIESHEFPSGKSSKLSRSLPTKYSSDESDEETDREQRYYNTSLNRSGASNNLSQRSNASSRSYNNTSNRLNNSQLHLNDSSSSDNSKQKGVGLIVSIACSVIVIVVAYFYSHSHVLSTTNIYDESKFTMDLQDLGEKYSVSDDSILKVQSGLSTIFDKEDTGSFIFLYNSKKYNYNGNKFNNFINDISNIAAKYLRNNSADVHHIILEADNIRVKSDSELINKYKEEIYKSGVMLVKGVDNLPSNLALAFHYYCDEYNPLVKKSAIFFTLDLGNCSIHDGTKHAVIEKCLKHRWQDIQLDQITPLLNRVVNTVVDVSNDF